MTTKRAKVQTKVREEFPSNSHSKREEPIQPLVQTRRANKRSGFAYDVRNITTTLFYDVMVPALKSMLADSLSRGVESALWGDSGESDSRSSRGSRRTNYGGMYGRQSRGRSVRRAEVREVTDILELDDIIFDTPEQARYVLDVMKDQIRDYGWCTVAQFLALSGQTNNWNHERYGWFSLKNVSIRRTSDGYYIDFPEPSFAD